MKLPKSKACLWALDGGNVKTKNMMVETTLYGLSDRGSIPLTSMKKILEILRNEYFEDFDVLCEITEKVNIGYKRPILKQ